MITSTGPMGPGIFIFFHAVKYSSSNRHYVLEGERDKRDKMIAELNQRDAIEADDEEVVVIAAMALLQILRM